MSHHIVYRGFIVVPLLAITPVFLVYLVVLVRVPLPFLEATVLLFRADVNPELEQHRAVIHQLFLEIVNLLIGAPPFMGPGETLHPFHQYAAIPRSIIDGKSTKRQINGDVRSPVEQHAAMSWAQRLKRVFNIDISTCDVCGSAVKVIASIEDPVVIKQILAHLERKAESKEYNPLPESRAPPQTGLSG